MQLRNIFGAHSFKYTHHDPHFRMRAAMGIFDFVLIWLKLKAESVLIGLYVCTDSCVAVVEQRVAGRGHAAIPSDGVLTPHVGRVSMHRAQVGVVHRHAASGRRC